MYLNILFVDLILYVLQLRQNILRYSLKQTIEVYPHTSIDILPREINYINNLNIFILFVISITIPLSTRHIISNKMKLLTLSAVIALAACVSATPAGHMK